MPAKPATVDEYIAGFPQDIQAILVKLRQTIQKAAPAAQEVIKYGMPTYTQKGNLVYFGAYKKHIGFYPHTSGMNQYKRELAAYEVDKGTVRFPLDKPIPYGLIAKLVKVRIKEDAEAAAAKTKKKPG
ncbi:MAG: DUF1801 domain-containing protein [Anaerolineales bacterium]